MRLTGYELKKLFLRVPVFLALIVFTLFDLAKIDATVDSISWLHEVDVWDRVYWEQYETYSGEITLEKINALLDLYKPLETAVNDLTATTRNDVEGTLTGNLYSDKNFLERYFVGPMKRFYTYGRNAGEIVSAANENAALYKRLGNAYEARKNAAIAELYRGRQVTEFAYTEGYELYLNYDFSTILALLLILYALSQTFSRDRECRMTELMLTAPGGGTATICAKIAAASLYIYAVSLWFSAVDFAGFAVFSNLTDAGGLPVYAADAFKEAPVRMTLFAYSGLSALTRALGFWALGMVFLALSEAGRHALLPFAAGAGVFLACTLAGVRWGCSSNTLAKVLNPYSVLVNRLLYGKTEFVDILGVPVLTWRAGLVFTAALGIAAGALAVKLGERNRLRKGARP